MALVKIAEILYIKYIIETSYFKKLDLSFLYYFTFTMFQAYILNSRSNEKVILANMF